ncbi:hypothetical protein RWV98_14605 [Agathobaculum sp. NTUH-O15-33]|uniref:hypothetical protein n=1 Tax=Agathobaculum sp. NTUH-O15-33 TaxID=3079302 RepID=UPI0029583430|nr:hypothetical protein [Agathobaculum sp. NTUH-O15-33]WNX83805.1 hypothetical protein RWV98_14605 [Agathobaculum sp. NTUH-O15-33]
MESFDFYAFLALATMLPLAIPFVVMLVDEWILSARLIRWAAVIVAIAALAAAGAIYHLFGCDRYGRDLVGSVPILIACGLFYLFTKCRDGRFLFYHGHGRAAHHRFERGHQHIRTARHARVAGRQDRGHPYFAAHFLFYVPGAVLAYAAFRGSRVGMAHADSAFAAFRDQLMLFDAAFSAP